MRKNVNSVKKSDGSYTCSPEETANEFVDFFHTVFQDELHGPLPKDCYNLNTVDYHTEFSVIFLSQIDITK